MMIAGLEPNLRVTTGPNLAWIDWSICSSSPIELLDLRNLPMMEKVEGPGGSFREGFLAQVMWLKMYPRRMHIGIEMSMMCQVSILA